MMPNSVEAAKEKIKFNIEILRLSWISILTTGGGITGLLLSELNILKISLIISGLIILLAFAIFIIHLSLRIIQLIKTME